MSVPAQHAPRAPRTPRVPLSPLTHDDPQELGGFGLLARLGSGGMGTVYLARSAAGRTVALKTVHARLAADATFRTRFRLEADAARVIGDRYGARVFAADALAATPWLATEYVIGPQLDEAVGLAGPLPEPCVRALGADLARALGQLHRSDVVHRDLKPSNVMVTAAGPKVIDFGIARALGDERLTRTGAAAGTPAFMSPEQAGGLEHSPAGDVFALAGVLVFAACGHGPFGGGRAADLLYRVRYAEPDLGGVPAALAPVLARCLDKDPARRPTTAELAELLAPGDGPFADGLRQPVLADIARRAAAVWQEPPARLPAPAGEAATVVAGGGSGGMSRRRLLAVGGGVAGSVAVAAGGGLWAWLGGRGEEKAAEPGPLALKPPPDALWQVDMARPLAGGVPVRVGGTLVMAAGVTTTSVSPKNGKHLTDFQGYEDAWRTATDGTVLYAVRKPDAADKALAVVPLSLETGREQAPLVRLPAFDGTQVLDQILGVAGDSVFLCAKAAANEQWFVVAAHLKTGKELWRQPTAGPSAHSTERRRPLLVRVKAVPGGVLLWQRAEQGDALRVSLHDATGGAERWAVSLSSPGATPHELVTDHEHVYVGAEQLQALRLADGTVAWSFGSQRDVGKVVAQRRYGLPTLRDGVVYAVEGTRGIVAVGADIGVLRWEEIAPDGMDPNREIAPVVTANHVYSMDAAGLRAVDSRSHHAVWRYETDAYLLAPDADGKQLYAREERVLIAVPTR
ncbi:protein kinase domain-containing protein [Streptomyces virginiae]|uniref:protein kinase domain-containing protein n=1 Tax=Streptomyces virginiae TaxID=1961 RepID=UPI0022522D76|nr:PQQ-binding-like beta-propeller repeat protein [Streptomyces virginiae]MCX4957474.1 serine/threonine-protein kinase [Streptomyces virginiae]